MRDYLKRVSRQIIGQEITPHYFRHRFLTECSNSRAPMTDVMAMSGLKDIKVLLTYYSHSTDKGLDKVLEASRI